MQEREKDLIKGLEAGKSLPELSGANALISKNLAKQMASKTVIL